MHKTNIADTKNKNRKVCHIFPISSIRIMDIAFWLTILLSDITRYEGLTVPVLFVIFVIRGRSGRESPGHHRARWLINRTGFSVRWQLWWRAGLPYWFGARLPHWFRARLPYRLWAGVSHRGRWWLSSSRWWARLPLCRFRCLLCWRELSNGLPVKVKGIKTWSSFLLHSLLPKWDEVTLMDGATS